MNHTFKIEPGDTFTIEVAPKLVRASAVNPRSNVRLTVVPGSGSWYGRKAVLIAQREEHTKDEIGEDTLRLAIRLLDQSDENGMWPEGTTLR